MEESTLSLQTDMRLEQVSNHDASIFKLRKPILPKDSWLNSATEKELVEMP